MLSTEPPPLSEPHASKLEDGGYAPAASSADTFRSLVATNFKAVSFALLPTPVQRRLVPSHFKPSRLHPTAYLDGLRGLAALFVFFCHFTSAWVPALWPYYGANNRNPIQLPVLRVIYSGVPMVHVFFVISGFVLSAKPLKLARSHRYDELHTTLSSSIFRRGLRLYLPPAASTLMMFLMIRHGWIKDDEWAFLSRIDGGFFPQLRDWIRAIFEFVTMAWGWENRQHMRYDGHLWTVPLEMSMSMFLFLALTGLSRCSSPVRLGMLVAIMLYASRCGHWAAINFLGGAFIAEVSLVQDEKSKQYTAGPQLPLSSGARDGGDSAQISLSLLPITPKTPPTKSRTISLAWKIFWWVLLLNGLFICSWPEGDVEQISGFSWMSHHSTRDNWWAFGALHILIACHQLPLLQQLLTTAPIQYLGNISYALYLVHGPFMYALAWRIMEPVWRMVGGREAAGLWINALMWFVGILLVGAPVLWLSDCFWRFVDQPAVKFARWLDGKCADTEQ